MEPNTDHIWQNKTKKQIHVGNHASNNNLPPNHFNFRLKFSIFVKMDFGSKPKPKD